MPSVAKSRDTRPFLRADAVRIAGRIGGGICSAADVCRRPPTRMRPLRGPVGTCMVSEILPPPPSKSARTSISSLIPALHRPYFASRPSASSTSRYTQCPPLVLSITERDSDPAPSPARRSSRIIAQPLNPCQAASEQPQPRLVAPDVARSRPRREASRSVRSQDVSPPAHLHRESSRSERGLPSESEDTTVNSRCPVTRSDGQETAVRDSRHASLPLARHRELAALLE